MDGKQLYRINLHNFEYENNCPEHLIHYIYMDEESIDKIKKYLSIHKLEYEQHNINGGHGCVIGFDFNDIFDNIKCKGKQDSKIINFLAKEKLERTEYFLKILKKVVEYHDKHCDCICKCNDCDPDNCKCEHCFGYKLDIF